MTVYVLDSSAVACLLRNEPGVDIVERLLIDSANQHYIHAVNWIEVRYLERRGHFPTDKPFSDFIRATGVTVVSELTPSFTEKVALLKADYPPIALGDCFAVALAQTLEAVLVTADRGELDKIATAGECQVLFVR